MALSVFFDRVQETSTTTGTGTLTLAGAVTGYQAFSGVIGSGTALVYYAIFDNSTGWEVGQGTYTFSGTTLSRTTILSSSNSNSAVSFGVGTKNVWLDFPASLIKPSGFIGVTQVEVDFGATAANAKTFTVTDANITTSHNIIMEMSGVAATGKSQDENEFDNIDFACVGNAGSITAYAVSQTGPVIGKFKVNYIYS